MIPNIDELKLKGLKHEIRSEIDIRANRITGELQVLKQNLNYHTISNIGLNIKSIMNSIEDIQTLLNLYDNE